MNIYYIALISVFASIIIADILPIVKEIKYRLNRETLKPFDCNFCLSGWIVLVLSIVFYSHWVECLIAIIVIPFITSLTYYFWLKLTKETLRLKNK